MLNSAMGITQNPLFYYEMLEALANHGLGIRAQTAHPGGLYAGFGLAV